MSKKKVAKKSVSKSTSSSKSSSPSKSTKPAPKAAVKKQAPKAAAKAVSKTAPKPAAAKPKTSPAKAASKTSAKTAPKKTGAAVQPPKPKVQPPIESAESAETTQTILSKRTRKATPAIFKIKSRKNTPILFTLDEVRQIIEKKKTEEQTITAEKSPVAPSAVAKKEIKDIDLPKQKSVHGAASVADILGFNPAQRKDQKLVAIDESQIPPKWKKYYKLLTDMRDHVVSGLDLHTKETLHRSSQDEYGNLSNYSQHVADAGSENFDRDFALSLVSSEQEALAEIDAAIRRIINDTYGVCEITGEAIKKERLQAVPFTRYSLEGQRQLEKNKVRKTERSGAFTDFASDEALPMSDDEE